MEKLEKTLRQLIRNGDLYDNRFKKKPFSANAKRKLKDYHIRDIEEVLNAIRQAPIIKKEIGKNGQKLESKI